MTLKPWKKISSKIEAENPYWKYRVDEFELPNGNIAEYFYADDKGASQIIGIDENEKIICIKQYRPIFGRFSIEFPCGGIEEDEDPAVCALREFSEETDLGAKNIEFVGKFMSSPGRTTQLGYVYVAHDLFDKPTKEDENEDLEVLRYSPDEIDKMIKNGEIEDGWLIVGWHLAKPRILEIIDHKKQEG